MTQTTECPQGCTSSPTCYAQQLAERQSTEAQGRPCGASCEYPDDCRGYCALRHSWRTELLRRLAVTSAEAHARWIATPSAANYRVMLETMLEYQALHPINTEGEPVDVTPWTLNLQSAVIDYLAETNPTRKIQRWVDLCTKSPAVIRPSLAQAQRVTMRWTSLLLKLDADTGRAERTAGGL